MTEHEWLECKNPKPMLTFLRGNASHRKLRLFGVACCRRIWHLLQDERCRNAVEVTERHADGDATNEEWQIAHAAVGAANREIYDPHPDDRSAHAAISIHFHAAAAAFCTSVDVRKYAFDPSHPAADAVAADTDGSVQTTKWRDERLQQTTLLLDIFCNPFRPVTLDPRWLTSTVVDLAQAIYDERAFDRMPILADALTDARCNNEDIIVHCRSEGPHVRGCWIVDLVLGKE